MYRRKRLPTPVFWPGEFHGLHRSWDRKVGHYLAMFQGFLDSSVGKQSACDEGDLGSIPGLGRSLGEGRGYPVHYSDLENSMECISHSVMSKTCEIGIIDQRNKLDSRSRPTYI